MGFIAEPRENDLKILLSLFALLLCAAPLYAEQALVLTEIEQIQEKIWYLQRDLAAQQAAIEKHQEQFTRQSAGTSKRQLDLETQLTAVRQAVAGQQEQLQGIEDALHGLKEAVAALDSEFNQQNRARLQQEEKSGSQEGLIRAMREEFVANRKLTEQALAETQQQLAETRSELAALQTNQSGRFNQLVLWGGGAAFALLILLTIILVLSRGGKRKPADKREFPTRHEM